MFSFAISATTDEKGLCALRRVPEEQGLRLVCSHPNFLEQERTIGDEQTEFAFTLLDAASFEVALATEGTAPDGEPRLYDPRRTWRRPRLAS